MTRNSARWYATVAGLAIAGLSMVVTPNVARSAVDADVRAGIYPEADAVSVGGGLLTPMGQTGSWYFNPNVEVALGDNRDIVMLSGDVHYDIAQDRSKSFWLGAGPAVMVTNRDRGDSDTDLGVNALAGVGAKRGNVRPFAQLRGTMADNSQVSIAGGIRF